MYFSKKFVHLIFLLAIFTVLLSMVYLIFFHPALSLESSRFEMVEDKIYFYSTIKNNSGIEIKNIEFTIINSNEKVFAEIPSLAPHEKKQIVLPLNVSNDLFYAIYITAPFSKTIYFPFELEESLVKPLKLNLDIKEELKLGENYPLDIEVCNQSGSDLIDVYFSIKQESGYFENRLFPSTFSLQIGECKHLNYTLVPISSGETELDFILEVHKQVISEKRSITIRN